MLKYIGGGAFIYGVPARDLTDAEEAQHGKLIAEQQKLTGLTLYTKPAPTKAAKGDKEG